MNDKFWGLWKDFGEDCVFFHILYIWIADFVSNLVITYHDFFFLLLAMFSYVYFLCT